MADRTPSAAQASGASRVRTPNHVAPETPMPMPSQLTRRDVATARLYPLRGVQQGRIGAEERGGSEAGGEGDVRGGGGADPPP